MSGKPSRWSLEILEEAARACAKRGREAVAAELGVTSKILALAFRDYGLDTPLRYERGYVQPPGVKTAAASPQPPAYRGAPLDDFDLEDEETRLKPPAPAPGEYVPPPAPAPERPSRPRLDADPKPTTAVEDYRAYRARLELDAAQGKVKDLLEEIHLRDQWIASLTELSSAPPLARIVAPKGRGEGRQRIGCAVMLCSDWHIEEPVEPSKVAGLNEYNLQIAEACIEKLADAYEWLSNDKRFDVRTGLLWLGGDLFSGHIHDELVEQNFLSPTQATLWLQDRIERMIRTILARSKFERLIVVCNDGNHGRLTHKMRISTRTANSLEWLMYMNLARRMQDEPRIEWHVADGEYSYVEVFGQTICFFHGDSVRYQGGVGGLLIPMKRGLNELRKYRDVHHFCFGHFHTRLDLPDMTGNGSMIGITPYGMSKKMTPERRQQSFFLIDSEEGKCISAPVWLGPELPKDAANMAEEATT